MATINLKGTIQMRQDTSTNWESKNPILKAGEIGYDTTTGDTKIGDGVKAWKQLVPFLKSGKTIYGVKIDRNNSNPATAVTYTDAASGFTAATSASAGSWGDKWPFNQIKPCLFKSGAVVGYLNPNNYAQFEAGGAADITSGSAGDVMVEFPKIYYKITQDTNYTYVQICDSPLSVLEGFTDWAYSYKGTVRDKFYIGAYKGFISGSGLYSTSGKIPTVERTIGQYRTAAQYRGAGYEIMPFNKLTLLQALYLIRFKNLNCQTALGKGYTEDYDYNYNVTTGATNANGMYYGSTSNGMIHAKCHGVEDFWGFIYEWIDGLIQSNYVVYTADGNFNDTAANYKNTGLTLAASVGGYVRSIQGTNDLGFLVSNGSGSATTYYSDYGYISRTTGVFVPFAGGSWDGGGVAGAFFLDCGSSPSSAGDSVGARLCFCG